jgi:hypothetical protein
MAVPDPADAAAAAAAEADLARPDPLPENEDGTTPSMTSAFTNSFAPKEKDDDGTPGSKSLYDNVNYNSATAVERRRQATLRKVQAAQKKMQQDVDRMNRNRARQTEAYVQKMVEEQRRMEKGDADLEYANQDIDQAEDLEEEENTQ